MLFLLSDMLRLEVLGINYVLGRCFESMASSPSPPKGTEPPLPPKHLVSPPKGTDRL